MNAGLFSLHADERFRLLDPLPVGTTVLEASAGTGKTWTIASLVVRYVAEGVATMDELLVVSFSRESTRELRERVRGRLVAVRDGLDRAATAGEAGAGTSISDVLIEHLLTGSEHDVRRRRQRLQEALASFDAATVTTIHGFCQQALLALGVAADHDPGATLVQDVRDLVREAADDLFLRKWGTDGSPPPDLDVTQFHALADAAALHPATTLLPDITTPAVPGLRARIAQAVRGEVDRRKRNQHLIGYDDMLTRLAATLTSPGVGTVAAARLRGRYSIVLVDEFQDTDPVQWSILRTAFGGDGRTMVLIGDPKQAIYAFRGADVHSYLDAMAGGGTRRTLPVSYRSDAALLRGLDAVFRGAALGDERIRVVGVEAAHPGPMVVGPAGPPAVLRVLPRGDLPQTRQGLPTAGAARAAIARDLAAQTVALLTGGATVRPRDGGPERGLLPGDVAVLVRENSHAVAIATQLAAAGLPVVMTGRRSVFETAAAQEWQLLLEALEQPHRATRVRRLALSCWAGVTAAGLDADGERITEDLTLQLRRWITVLDERGLAAMFERVCLDRSVPPRVLRQDGGERLLTDLRHIAQVLHEAVLADRLGLAALLTWLRHRRDEAAGDGGLERSRRLESDAAAVQVITVHTSKGLEFPVVMVPFAWNWWGGRDVTTAVFHDDDGHRVRDVGGPGSPDWRVHEVRHRREEADDELRLTYVALTRAQARLVMWWAPTANTPSSPLHRLLLAPDGDGSVPPESIPVPTDAEALAAFGQRAAGSDGGLGVELIGPPAPATYAPPAPEAVPLDVARLDRDLDLAWRRTSYTALTAGTHEARLGSEPGTDRTEDEQDVETATGTTGSGIPSRWHELPGGTGFGTLVHAVLEDVADPSDPDAVRTAVVRRAARTPQVDAGLLTDALIDSLATGLGELADGRALRDFTAADRLPELDFELPMAGGDRSGSAAHRTLDEIAGRWREHAGDGPLASYADALATLEPAPLRGYLTGSIDAVLRVGSRFLVVDYKTNRLGGVEEPLTTWHYRPEALRTAMIDAHYPLQALLYQVALHRYLRWRLPDYDPGRHLGGALYLFLRGMTGPGADGAGVFAWRPPAGLVVATSDLLAGSS